MGTCGVVGVELEQAALRAVNTADAANRVGRIVILHPFFGWRHGGVTSCKLAA
jgi:hypothetical protein